MRNNKSPDGPSSRTTLNYKYVSILTLQVFFAFL
jgi:hypothetical protein